MILPSILRTLSFPICTRMIKNAITDCNFTGNSFYSLPPTKLKNFFNNYPKNNTVTAAYGKNTSCSSDNTITFSQPCLRDELLCKTSAKVRDSLHKVTVVGAGMVGVATCNALLMQGVTSHVALVDVFPKKLEGEGMDYNHAAVYLDDARVDYDTDFCITSNSQVVIIAAGVRQKKGETRLDLIQRNSEIMKTIIPTLVGYSPNAVFLIISNPVDILAWITWKVSGLPVHRIVGTGCHLDAARFRYLISERLGVSPKSVHGYIIGEHGDSQVPVWSGVSVGGIQLRDILPNMGMETDEEKWSDLHKEVIRAGPTVRCLKGYSNTAIGLCAADITKAILRNTNAVIPVSTLIKGHYEINHEIFLSLPCTVGEHGISQVIRLRMTEQEKKLLLMSAKAVYNVQKDVKL